MNNPENIAIDIEAEVSWLNEHKRDTGHSWSILAKKTGIPLGTISQFAAGSYGGDMRKLAETVYRYRQLLIAQASVAIDFPECPPFYETPTTRRIFATLTYAQRGRIVMVTGSPGTSKTATCRHYQAAIGNVWIATMDPTTTGVQMMLVTILKALGESDAKGAPQVLLGRVKKRVADSGGLLIIDEAQFLSEMASETLRSLYDETGIGIAFVGNRDVLARIQHGSKVEAYARLASRRGPSLMIHAASEGDADALADAWGVEDAKCRAYIRDIASKPGGLRSCTMMLETAGMLAAIERGTIGLDHLQDARSSLSPQGIAA